MANIILSSKRLPIFQLDCNGHSFHVRDEEFHSTSRTEISSILPNKDLRLFRTCFVDRTRFTIFNRDTTKPKRDNCILFLSNNKPTIGFITNIILIDSNTLLFRVNRAFIRNQLHVILENRKIACKNIWKGDIDSAGSHIYVKIESVIEKILHVYDKKYKCYFFFKIPNLCESS